MDREAAGPADGQAAPPAAGGRRVRFLRPSGTSSCCGGSSGRYAWGALLAAVLLIVTVLLASQRGGLQPSSLLIYAMDKGAAAANRTSAALADLAASARAAAAARAASSGGRQYASVADKMEAERGEIPDGPEVQGLACQESGFCSLGKLQPYVGRVDSTEEFRAMLNASCYKKECILVTIGSGGHLLGMNLVSSAWQLGLANILLHAKNNESCAVLGRAGYHNVTCVWSERDWFPYKNSQYGMHEAQEVWLLRYLMVSRAVWWGYNVLMLDTDSWLYRDPYVYLTRPPFANISFIGMQETKPGGGIINGGSYYIRGSNVPGGPAAYFMASVVEHMIRVNERWLEYHKAYNVTIEGLGGYTMDQFVLSDMVAGQYLGYPTHIITLGEPSYTIDKAKHEARIQYRQHIPLVYPPEWHKVTGAAEELVGGHNLTVPYLNGSWPVDSAGPLLPRANYSEYYVKMLEEESGYPFPDIMGSPPPGSVQRNETIIFAPSWLLGFWFERGIDGWWEIEPVPPQVIVHVVFVPGNVHPPWKKEYILKASNAFDANVPLGLNGKLIPASTPEQPLPRVLALLPGARVEAASAEEYRARTAQLVRLAMRLNRVALMPEPVCDRESWVNSPGSFSTKQLPTDPFTGTPHTRYYVHIGRMMMYGLDDDYHCVWWPHVEPGCHEGAFTIHADFKALVKRLPPGAGVPGPDNTLQIGAGAPLQSVLDAARQRDTPHVLFLSAVPDLGTPLPDGQPGEDERFNKWATERCYWMREMPNLDRRRRRLGEQQGRHTWKWEEQWDV